MSSMTPGRTPISVGIAGAGNAGLAAALALARAGHRVHVYEKHAGLAPLGAGLLLQPPGVRALADLGIDIARLNVGAPIERLLGVSHRGWRIVDIDYAGDGARAVNRAVLGSLLFEAARQAGVEFHFACPVKQLGWRQSMAHVEVEGGSADFDLFVIADGAASQLREQVGLAARSSIYKWGALWGQFWVPSWDKAAVLHQRFRGTAEMMGLLPTDIGERGVRLSLFWSIRHDAVDAWRAAPLEGWKKHLLSLWPDAHPVVQQIRMHDDLALATYRHTWPKALANGPYCAVGDAAHAMSPQLGLGTTLAVLDALALARAVSAVGPVQGAAQYARQRLRPSRAYQTLSRMLTPCFQASGRGVWRDLAFAGSLLVPGMPWLMKRSLLAMPARGDRGA